MRHIDVEWRRVFPVLMCVLAVTGCGPCQEHVRYESRSPQGTYVVKGYSHSCGPMTPFNDHVALGTEETGRFDDVVAVRELPFHASADWASPDLLRITIDCQFADAAGCLTERAGTIRMRKQWRNLRIEYAVGPRLRAMGATDILTRFASWL